MAKIDRSFDTNLAEINVIWFKSSLYLRDFDELKYDLQQLVPHLLIFHDVDQCIQYLNVVHDRTLLLIVHESNSQQIIDHIIHLVNIRAIYILCESRSVHPKWSTSLPMSLYRQVDQTSLCQQIRRDVQDANLAFNILSSSGTDYSNPRDFNRQESTFIYGQLMIKILTEMSYTDKHMRRMIDFLKEKCKNHAKDIEKINEFSQNYSSNSAIWCYTHYSFLYLTINEILRNFDVSGMYKMGIFIRDLHHQIVEICENSFQNEVLRVYRGAQIPMSIFEEKLKGNEGALLSVNEFLSTSTNDNVAEIFASRSNQDHAAVLFHITIDPSTITSHWFANIQPFSQFVDEEEYLFTTGSVFRIESIEQMEGDKVWRVSLVLTTDHDKELRSLADFYQRMCSFPNVSSFIVIALDIAEYEMILEISAAALEETDDPWEKCFLHFLLGISHCMMGHYDKTIKEYEKALEYRDSLNMDEENDDVCVIMKVTMLHLKGKTDLALSCLQQAICNEKQKSDPQQHAIELATYHQMISRLLQYKGDISGSYSHQQEVQRFAGQCGLSCYPALAFHHQSFAELSLMQNRNDQVLESLQRSKEVFERVLPINHPLRSYYEVMSRINQGIVNNQPFICTSEPISSVEASALTESKKISPMLQILQYFTEMKHQAALDLIDNHLKSKTHDQLSLDPNLFEFYYLKGLCHFGKSETNIAIENFEKSFHLASLVLPPKHYRRLEILLLVAIAHAALMDWNETMKIIDLVQQIGFDLSQNFTKDIHNHYLKVISFILYFHALSDQESEENEKALCLFQKCLKIQLLCLLDADPKLAETYEHIALAFRRIDNLSAALINYKKAQPIREKNLSSAPSRNVTDSTLSNYIHSQLKMVLKTKIQDESIFDYLFNENISHHLLLIDNYLSVAEILMIQENFVDAIVQYRLALDVQVNYVATVDMSTVYIWIQLSEAYGALELHDDYLGVLLNGLKILLSMDTPDPYQVDILYKAIGRFYIRQQNYPEALLYFEQCLKIEEEQHDDHALADTHQWISLTLKGQGKISDTQMHLYKALNDSTFSSADLIQSARLSLEYANHQKSLDSLRQCLELQRKFLPSEHLDFVETYSLIGETMFALQRVVDAVKCYEYVLQILIKYLPDTTSKMIETLMKLAEIHLQSHEFEDCLSTYEEVLELELNSLFPIHVDIAKTHKQIALVEYVMGRFDDALDDFEKCMKIQMVVLPAYDPDLLDTRNRIIDLCSNLNKMTRLSLNTI